MKKILLPLIFSILIFMPLVGAESIKSCLDTDTLQVNTTTTIWVDANETQINTTEEVYCRYGCADNQCTPGTVLNTITFPLFFVLFAFFVVFARIFENPLFGTVAASISLILGILLIGQGISFSETILSNMYTVGIGTIFLALSVYIGVATWLDRLYHRESISSGE